MNQTTAALVTLQSGNLSGGGSGELYVFTTASGEPNFADWPNGEYRCQLNVNAVGADITFGMRAAGTANGHFARVDSALSSDLQTWTQDEALFSGSGLKLATHTIDPSAGSASDRYEVVVAGTRPASHGNQRLDLDVNTTDSFVDGPWVPAGPGDVFFENKNPIEQGMKPLTASGLGGVLIE
jgi:hypothetical protein